ncbi:MAG: methyltransferase domain-containing protein [Ignavibacteria bacterium]|nr:methyltransferase domain-containing protein [Ignavibacteria bacterium]
MSSNQDYILGINQTELERLEFQNNVWKKMTDDFLERIKIEKNWKCLDAGAGPGFVSANLRNLVGDSGEVTALEPSQIYLDHFRNYCSNKNWDNIKFIQGNVEDTDLEKEYYDFIFLRWVIDFVNEPEKFLLKLTDSLKKGGIIGIQDYSYEGIALFPKGGAFDNITEIVRKYYGAGGGDLYFTTKIPSVFRKNKIELMEFSPVSKAGGNDSDVFEWAYRFFKVHLPLMADKNLISRDECNELLKDLNDHKNNPDMIFFSPVIVNIAGKKL